MAPALREPSTEEEYLAGERLGPARHEYVNGRIVAMVGGSPLHNLIAANIARALGERLRGRPGLVFCGSQRVAVPSTRLFTYPDVGVVRGAVEAHPRDPGTLINPVVLVEILSDDLGSDDRAAKFSHYRQLDSLREYLLVEESQRRVDHFRRGDRGEWILTACEDDAAVAVPALELILPLSEIYEKVA